MRWKDKKESVKTKIYKINNGNMFEGTLEQFEDNFFSYANDESIKLWCSYQGYTLEILFKEM